MISTLFICSIFIWGAKPRLGHDTTVVYWGQDALYRYTEGKKVQTALREYCIDEVDIVVLSVAHVFGSKRDVQLNFANIGEYPAEADKIKAIGEDIGFCQKKNKTVLLSMGGSIGKYGFSSYEDAESVAVDFFNMFGNGKATDKGRPFGDAVIDGYDLDIENYQSDYYEAFVDKMRVLDSSVIISAAPQCPFPDENLDKVLQKSFFDYIFIQFYNTPYCSPLYDNGGVDDSQWSYPTWIKWAVSSSLNKEVRVFLGTPGCPTPYCAGSSYLGFENLEDYIIKCVKLGDERFGGVMIWDASAAFENTRDKENFVQYTKFLLNKYSKGLVSLDDGKELVALDDPQK